MKLTYKYVKEQIEKCGYKLLSEKYKNSATKLNVECSEGHQYEVSYNTFQQGRRCFICSIQIRANKKRLTYDFVKQQFCNNGYKLLSKTYKRALSKLLVECPAEHKYKVRYSEFQQGQRCPVCVINNRADNQRLSYEYVKKQFENERYKLLSKEYNNVHDKLKVECPEKHQYEVEYANFQQGKRCPVCWELETHSRSEKDCLGVVKQIIPNEIIIENDRSQIINPKSGCNLELDIWIPSLNKAVEFNGEYWHSSNQKISSDKEKVKQCDVKGIDLLTIWYQDWIDNREEQIDNLKRFILKEGK